MAVKTQAAKAAAPAERMVLRPEERFDALRDVIRSARKSLILSLFRCDDFRVLDELAEALQRGVRVEALLTRRAKGWKKRLTELWEFLESMGAKVYGYADPVVKYHAKYILADDGPALIASLNFTRKCFTGTCDFLHVTHDPAVVSGLKRLFQADCNAPDSEFPEDISERLIVGPDRARAQFTDLLQSARRSIRIIDHKLTDPSIVTLLKAKKADGIEVTVLKRGPMAGLDPHGKMILIDEERAAIGSIGLSALAMDFRREVALMIEDPASIQRLNEFFQTLAEEDRQRPVVKKKKTLALEEKAS